MKRTCLVTKTKADPQNLLRFTVQAGQLKFDNHVKAEGRGGYVIKDLAALEKLPQLSGKIAYFLKVKKVAVSETEIELAKSFLLSIPPRLGEV